MKTKNEIYTEERLVEALKRFMDGDPKNIDPLKSIPNPKMTLYVVRNENATNFFDTELELIEYIKNNTASKNTVFTVEYLGYVAGRNDVIRQTTKKKSTMLTMCDSTTYEIYNDERSFYKGEFVWEINQGSLEYIYEAFQSRGIYLTNDVYHKDEIYQTPLVRTRN